MKVRLARIALLIACALFACVPSVAFASAPDADEPDSTAIEVDVAVSDRQASEESEPAGSDSVEGADLDADFPECDPVVSGDLIACPDEPGDASSDETSGLPECDAVNPDDPVEGPDEIGGIDDFPECEPVQSANLTDDPESAGDGGTDVPDGSSDGDGASDEPGDGEGQHSDGDDPAAGENADDAESGEDEPAPVSVFVGGGSLANGDNLVGLVNKAKLVAAIDAVVLNADTLTRSVEEVVGVPLDEATANVRAALNSDDVAVIYTGKQADLEEDDGTQAEVVRGPVSIGGAYLYSVGDDEVGDAESASTAAEAFSEWAGSLGEAEQAAPIVVMLEKGIHERDDKSEGASVWLNTINSVAESVPVIVTYSKDQTSASSGTAVADIVKPGESMPTSDDDQSTEIKFTYMNVGNIEEGSGSLLSIDKKTVTVNRIGVNGWIDTQEIRLGETGEEPIDEDNPETPDIPDNPGDTKDPSDPSQTDVPGDLVEPTKDPEEGSNSNEKPSNSNQNDDPSDPEKPKHSDKPVKRDKPESDDPRSDVGAVAYAYPDDPADFDGGDSGNAAGQSGASKRTNKLFDPVPENEEVPVKNMVDEMLGRADADGATAPAEKDRSAFPAALVIVLLSGIATLVACKKLYRAA